MALSIPGPLASAMSLMERNPRVRLTSGPVVSPLPTPGIAMPKVNVGMYEPGNEDEGSMSQQAAIVLSDGRILEAHGYVNGLPTPALNKTIFMLSNVERTEWTRIEINGGGYWGRDLIELADGRVGFLGYNSWYIWDPVAAPTYFAASGVFETTQSPDVMGVVSGPSVTRRADGSYLMVYVLGDTSIVGFQGPYSLVSRTSTDFQNWSAATTITTGHDPDRSLYNPTLVTDSDGSIALIYEYAESGTRTTGENINLFLMGSTNNGSTWSTPDRITDYALVGTNPKLPDAVLVEPGSIALQYTFQQQSNWMGSYGFLSTPGWLTEGADVRSILLDEAGQRVILAVQNQMTLGGIVVADSASWEVIKKIDSGGSPSLNDMFFTEQTVWKSEPDYPYMVVWTNFDGPHIAVYNAETDTVKEYHFKASSGYNVLDNMGNSIPVYPVPVLGISAPSACALTAVYIDAPSNRLYMLWRGGYGGIPLTTVFHVSYIDLNQTIGAEGSYSHTTLWAIVPPADVHQESWSETPANKAWWYAQDHSAEGVDYARMPFRVYPDDNLVIINSSWDLEGMGGPYIGAMWLFTMAGQEIAFEKWTLNGGFPYNGVQDCVYKDGVVYASFDYQPDHGNNDKVGLLAYTVATRSCQFLLPTFATMQDYGFKGVSLSSSGNEVIVSSDTQGLVFYDIATGLWKAYNEATIPGIFNNWSGTAITTGEYDPATEMFYAGCAIGVFQFHKDGPMAIGYSMSVTHSGGVYTTGTPVRVTAGSFDSGIVGVPNPAGPGMYYFWTKGLTTHWTDASFAFDLSAFLSSGSSVTVKRSISGNPNTLEFTLTHGHLFDVHNTLSLYADKVKKNRRVLVEFGELIGGSVVWQGLGEYYVVSTKIGYRRGDYPTISVECEDLRRFWEDADVVATPQYDSFPEEIISGLLTSVGGLSPGDIDLPVFENRVQLEFAWLDTNLKKVIEEVMDRFGYVSTVRPDGKVSAIRINVAKPVDHTYPNRTTIVDFTSDDAYSDYTNRVVVVGESKIFQELVYAEEAVGQASGAIAWWGGEREVTVWFSEDHKKRARNVRMVVNLGVRNVAFGVGGGSEYISFHDPDEKFVVVTIEYPNLVPEAAAALVSLIAIGMSCGASVFVSGGCFIGFCLTLAFFMYIVVQMGMYMYEFYGQPFGEERLGVQGNADDFEHQLEIARIVEKKIEEPLCVTAEECSWLAAQEISIAKAQRMRVSFSKIADYRDEEGDVISIPHPYTNLQVKIYITDLIRKFEIPSAEPSSGGVIDQIEGWVL
jgi:hypothetical protein